MASTQDNVATDPNPLGDWTLVPGSADAPTRPAVAAPTARAPCPNAYPDGFCVKLQEKVYTPEDYPALITEHGRYMVLLGRFPDDVHAFVVATGLVKLGIFGRCTKRMPTAAVLPYVGVDERALFDGRPSILVCTPPLTGDQALVIAEMAMVEDAYFGSKVPLLDALDIADAFDAGRVDAIFDDLMRYLNAARASYNSRVEQVEPPVGEWNIYTHGGGIPPPDKITNAIKGFASHSTRVFPPLPPLDDAEAGALLHIHDLLCRNGRRLQATQLVEEALSGPLFTGLCHRPAIFAPDRSPRLEVTWWKYGPALLKYLLSEELTHAARRDTAPDAVTLKSPFVLTLDEIIAMNVNHAPKSVTQAFDRLNTYVGGYLGELDLSKTLITGSAIAASLIVTNRERAFELTGRDAWMA